VPKSVEMSPAFAIHYDFNRGGRNAISPSQVVETSRRNSPSGALVVIRAVLNADSTYLVIRKFRLMVSYAARWILRSLSIGSVRTRHNIDVIRRGNLCHA
jgi:hypothetical protein